MTDGSALTYDAANQLTGLTKQGGQIETFGYDQVGDRTSQTGDATATYGFDQARRLVSTQTAAGEASYAYNGDGLRVSETVAGQGNTFAWDINAPVPLLLADGSNDYVYGPTLTPIEQVDRATGTVTFLHADRLGSVRALTDASGSLVGSASYGPYGATTAHSGSATAFGYTGQYTDANGLIYLRARYYDPSTAQFLTSDPAFDQTRARYSYAGGDPVDVTDPTGRMPMPGGPDGGCFYNGDAAGCIGSYPIRPPSYGGLTPDQTTQVAVNLYESGEPWYTQVYDPTTLALLYGVLQPCDVTSQDLVAAEQQQGDLAAAMMLVDYLSIDADAYQQVDELLFSLTGLPDAQKCASSGSGGSCADAILMFLPTGKLAKMLDALRDLVRARRALRLAEGSLKIIGEGFSASEKSVAQDLVDQGHDVVLRQATGVGRTSDLIVDGVPYDVYTPQAGTSARNILSEAASKWNQVDGGGVVVDISNTGLSLADFGTDPLGRVNGFIKSWGGKPLSDLKFYGA